jgi:thymidylate synthase
MTEPEVAETFGKYIPTATVAWRQLLSDLCREGNRVTVRGLNIVETMHRSCVIDMKSPIVNVADRKLGSAFLFAEAAWILGGHNDVASIAPFAKRISEFSDDGIFFRGAYGPQIVQQMPYIIESIKNDLFTRQAVISIWKPSPMPSKDIPCTVTCQFMVRGGLLHTFVDMRSSDAWLGVPYDWFNFSMLSAWLMLILRDAGIDVELGFLHFKANSQHFYESDEAKIKSLLAGDFQMNPALDDLQDFITRMLDHSTFKPTDFVRWLWEVAESELEYK